MSGGGETVIYYPNPWKLWLFLAICLGFAALGALMALTGWRMVPRDVVMVVVGGIGLVFFGACALAILYGALRRAPTLVLSPRALSFGDPTRANALSVPWSKLDGISLFGVAGQSMIGIEVADEEALLDRMTRGKRALFRANVRMGYPLLSIAQSAVAAPLDEVAETILHYRERYA